MPRGNQHLWWQKGVLYQIYPRSFQDTDGDGCGDLAGIRKRIPYLVDLGVDAVWLSPIFPSPMADFGYDVADYTAIDTVFGSLEEFDRLLEACHASGLRLLLDFVPNHSSDRHPWFIDSRSGRESPRRDWYIWEEPSDGGGPPNNWLSVFGGSAWKYDEASGQYYHHAFLEEQPDLNWRNDSLRQAMLDVLKFWFDRGVDGFRIDVLWHIVKDAHLRDNPVNPDYEPGDNPYNKLEPVYSTDQPEVHEIAAKMREIADDFGERVLIGEVYLPVERLMEYYGRDGNGVHLPFNFQLLTLTWDANTIRRAIRDYEEALPEFGWPNWVLSNHDDRRIAGRVGAEQARVAAVMLLTLRGTPTIYYGDEIGISDVHIPEDQLQDPQGLRLGREFSRDPSRTPMPWDATPNGGFTTGDPWLPLNPDFARRNVEAQTGDPDSMLELYRTLLTLRRTHPVLAVGDYIPLDGDGDVVAYIRKLDQDELLVALNLSAEPEALEVHYDNATIILSTDPARGGEAISGNVQLRGHEALIIDIKPHPPTAAP